MWKQVRSTWQFVAKVLQVTCFFLTLVLIRYGVFLMFCVKLSIDSEANFGGSIHMTLCHDFLNTYKHTFMSERKQMHQSIRVRCMKKNVAFLWHTYSQAITGQGSVECRTSECPQNQIFFELYVGDEQC